MYRKTFYSSWDFLKKHWFFTLIVMLIYTAIGYSYVWLNLLGLLVLQPSQYFGAQLLLAFALFPLSLGVIKCLDVAKDGEKKNPCKLFYFYSRLHLLGKALLLGLLVESFLALLSEVFQTLLPAQEWAIACWSIFVLILKFYLFLASYIIVKDSTLGIGEILKASFCKIKGNVNQLLFLHITLAILYFLMASLVSSSLLPFSLSETWVDVVNFMTQMISNFVSGIILFCFADNLLTQLPQSLYSEDRQFNYTPTMTEEEKKMRNDYDETEPQGTDLLDYDEDAEYDEEVDIEGYDSSQFDEDTLRNYRLFSDYEEIDPRTITYDVSLQKLDGNVGVALCDNDEIYFFLKDDREFQKLVEKVYTLAKFEYQSYVEDTRTGIGFDVANINSNKISLELSLAKVNGDNGYSVHVHLKINSD